MLDGFCPCVGFEFAFEADCTLSICHRTRSPSLLVQTADQEDFQSIACRLARVCLHPHPLFVRGAADAAKHITRFAVDDVDVVFECF